MLTRCLDVVAPHGMVVSYASTLMDPAMLGPRWFGAHLGVSLRSMLIFEELKRTQSASSDLSTLCALIADGVLTPHIPIESDLGPGRRAGTRPPREKGHGEGRPERRRALIATDAGAWS